MKLETGMHHARGRRPSLRQLTTTDPPGVMTGPPGAGPVHDHS